MYRRLLLSLILLVVASSGAMAQQIDQVALHCPVYLTWEGCECYVAVRNTTGSDVGVTPGFSFDGNHTVPYTLITVPAHGTILFTVDEFLDTPTCISGVFGIELSYAGEPGAIMASVITFFGNISFQVPFRNPSGDLSRTLHSSLYLGGDFIDYIFVKNTTENQVTVSPIFHCNGASTPGMDVSLEGYQ
ncbi:hypothetical protein J7M28_10745, partial [bacterium]|nr:hypothetical protein [bacterium]